MDKTQSTEWLAQLRADFPEFDLTEVSVGSGWDGLTRELLTKWRGASGPLGRINVQSIHKDHGELRAYYETTPELEGAAENAYDDIQVRSHVTCELTGAPGLLVERDGVKIVRAYDLLKPGDVISDPN